MRPRACLFARKIPSVMEVQTPEFSQDEKNLFLNALDLNMNATILQALLHGESIPPFLRFTLRSLASQVFIPAL